MYEMYGKRLFDISVAVIASALLLPVFIAIAVCIRLTDPGPIIFRQQRLGEGGKLFCFHKFRSMPVDTGDLPSDTLKYVELTWIGKFIRRTNLDELPQLFNILVGNMSIVGPRPPIASQSELIEYRRRNGAINCRPGLTGLAQIKSYDGMPVSEKAYLDGQYAKSISFLGDLKLIMSTFNYLRKPPPIY